MKRTAVLLSSLLVAVAAQAGAQERATAPPTVTVVGQASEDAQPDVAWIDLTIRNQKPNAAEAANDNAHRANAVVAALTAAGVAAKDIATLGLSLNPVWSEGNSPRAAAAYEATNRLSVRIQPVDRAGAIIAQAVLAGAEYQGVDFDLSDRETRLDALRGRAVQNAAHRAALYAAGAAMKLGPLQSIQAEAGQPAARPFEARAFAATAKAPTPTPIAPGQVTLAESVTATWILLAPQ